MSSTTTKYPLDFDALEKGMTISRTDLEEIFGINASEDPKAYSFKMMALRDQIIQRTGILVRSSNETLVLMDDEEGADYNFGTFKKGLRSIVTSVFRLQLIDTDKLSLGSKARFESRSRVMSGTVQATLAAERKQKGLEKLIASGLK
jgi:hypothetical protein